MSLSLLASAHALPASQSAALSPAGSALVRGLWTADETKVNLRNATSFLLQSKQAAAGQCWMWSDPHVETLGGDSADFMPHEDPIHTLVAKPGAYNIQSYHCPVVQVHAAHRTPTRARPADRTPHLSPPHPSTPRVLRPRRQRGAKPKPLSSCSRVTTQRWMR